MAIMSMVAAALLVSVAGTDRESDVPLQLAQATVSAQAELGGGNVKAKVRRRPCKDDIEEDGEESTEDQSVRGRKCKGGPGTQGK